MRFSGSFIALVLVGSIPWWSEARAQFGFDTPTAEEGLPPSEATSIAKILGLPSAKSAMGRDFMVFQGSAQDSSRETRDQAAPRLLIQGGLHGNEPLASDFVLWLAARHRAGKSVLNQLNGGKVEIDFLPYANPDAASVKSRYNARGVNLNRNFSVLWGMTRENPGTQSFSEAETQAIRALFLARRYDAAVDVHGFINWVVAPSAKVRHSNNEQRQRVQHLDWLAVLQRTVSRLLPDYKIKTAGALGDGGAFEDWAFWEAGSLAYCLELRSPMRFSSIPFQPLATDISRGREKSEDSFLKYERFVFETFERAIALQQEKARAR